MISPSVKNNPPRQQQVSYIDWLNHPTLVPQCWSSEQTVYHSTRTRVHTLQRVCSQICTGVDRHLYSIHNCTCTCGQDFNLVHATPATTNAQTPAHARLRNGAATSLPWKTLRAILNLENFILIDGKQKHWIETNLEYTPFLPICLESVLICL